MKITLKDNNFIDIENYGRTYYGEFAHDILHHYNKFLRDEKFLDTDDNLIEFSKIYSMRF